MKLLTRYKLKVYIIGEPMKIHKSDDRDYIDKLIEAYKFIYKPPLCVNGINAYSGCFFYVLCAVGLL